ncbi:MAG: hypothetical protein RDU01_03490 [Thermodesulfovibrionales bacterium]|nr:hypothetical protein [Thermodesulfovibrionales bacterium]
MKTKAMILSGIFTMVFLFALGFSQANAAIPYTINYQGYLTNATGSPVDGTVSMTFTFYTTVAGGTAIWTETQNVDVSGGIYSVILGSLSTLTPLAFDVPYWLGVRVGSDAEMTPRVQLTSVGYAFTSDMAMDLVCPGCVNFSDIGQNGCTANQFMMWSGTAWTCSAPTGITETDPQVGTLAAGSWCTSDGTAVNCAQTPPVLIEADPQVNTLAAGGWCVSDGSVINCNATPGAESDPQVGATTANLWCRANAGGTALDCNQTDANLAAAHNHDATYVNVTGDSMTGTLGIVAGAGNGLNATASVDSWVDAIADISLGGNIGEILTTGTSLDLYSNGDVYIDLDNDNNGTNVFQIYNGTDNPVLTIDESGNVDAIGTVTGNGVRVRDVISKPLCDAANGPNIRGMLWFTNGITGAGATADTLEVCAKDAGDAYAWRTLW